MSIMLLAIVVLSLIASSLLAITAGLLVYRERKGLASLTDRLLAEERIEASTRATLQAMRDGARQQMRN